MLAEGVCVCVFYLFFFSFTFFSHELKSKRFTRCLQVKYPQTTHLLLSRGQLVRFSTARLSESAQLLSVYHGRGFTHSCFASADLISGKAAMTPRKGWVDAMGSCYVKYALQIIRVSQCSCLKSVTSALWRDAPVISYLRPPTLDQFPLVFVQ